METKPETKKPIEQIVDEVVQKKPTADDVVVEE
jgi:hypothetical protein